MSFSCISLAIAWSPSGASSSSVSSMRVTPSITATKQNTQWRNVRLKKAHSYNEITVFEHFPEKERNLPGGVEEDFVPSFVGL